MAKYLNSFSHGLDYLQFRPQPPPQLISRIMTILQQKISPPFQIAIDVGCGSGQSTCLVAPHFTKVLALDSDSHQIDLAKKALKNHQNISFHVTSAENMPCEKGSASLVLAVQSAHWFDMGKFYKEVERVLIPGGVLALSGYRLPTAKVGNYDISDKIVKLLSETFKEYILDGSKIAYLENYRYGMFSSVPFTNKPVLREEFTTDWKHAKLCDLLGYIKTWSTYQNFLKKNGPKAAEDILDKFCSEIQTGHNYKDTSHGIDISFSYFLLLSQKPLLGA